MDIIDAFRSGNIKVVESIVKYGQNIDVNYIDEYGHTPLIYAVNLDLTMTPENFPELYNMTGPYGFPQLMLDNEEIAELIKIYMKIRKFFHSEFLSEHLHIGFLIF